MTTPRSALETVKSSSRDKRPTAAVARLRNSLSYAIHTFFQERNFSYVHTPVITTSDCEGAGAMFRVITLDLPGHGLTGAMPNVDYSERAMALFVKAFADKLGIERFAVGGNSMGGGVAARVAEIVPQRINQLILVDAADMETTFGDRLPLAFRLARIPIVNRLLLHITPRSLVVEGLNDAIVRKAALTDTLVDEYWNFARMKGTREATVARFRLDRDDYVRGHVGAIRVPTLILWGEKDHLIPVTAAYAWAKAIPGSKLVIYPATGHLPMEEVAAESASDVRAFLGTPAR